MELHGTWCWLMMAWTGGCVARGWLFCFAYCVKYTGLNIRLISFFFWKIKATALAQEGLIITVNSCVPPILTTAVTKSSAKIPWFFGDFLNAPHVLCIQWEREEFSIVLWVIRKAESYPHDCSPNRFLIEHPSDRDVRQRYGMLVRNNLKRPEQLLKMSPASYSQFIMRLVRRNFILDCVTPVKDPWKVLAKRYVGKRVGIRLRFAQPSIREKSSKECSIAKQLYVFVKTCRYHLLQRSLIKDRKWYLQTPFSKYSDLRKSRW